MGIVGQQRCTSLNSSGSDPDIIRRHWSSGALERRDDFSVDSSNLLIDQQLFDHGRREEFVELRLIPREPVTEQESKPKLSQSDGGYSYPLGTINERYDLRIIPFKVAVG